MKKLLALGLFLLVAACASEQKQTYPYNMTEKEWNELSIKDQTKMRRDYFFYEKGHIDYVNPNIEVEGRKNEKHFPLSPVKDETKVEEKK